MSVILVRYDHIQGVPGNGSGSRYAPLRSPEIATVIHCDTASKGKTALQLNRLLKVECLQKNRVAR